MKIKKILQYNSKLLLFNKRTDFFQTFSSRKIPNFPPWRLIMQPNPFKDFEQYFTSWQDLDFFEEEDSDFMFVDKVERDILSSSPFDKHSDSS